MPDGLKHGVEVVVIQDGVRPITTVKTSVIGLVGTAPDADAAKFPINTPVMIAGNRREAAGLGANGTLPVAIDGIFDQAGAAVVVIRVAEGADAAATQANVIGGVDNTTGEYQGLQALLGAESAIGFKPRILIAPGFSHVQAVLTEMVGVANKLRGFIYADGPNTNDADAIAYRGNFNSERLMIIDPWVKVFNTTTAAVEVQPASARVAGLRSLLDNEQGFWVSISNKTINGIVGTARDVDFEHGSFDHRANLLNEKEVTTIIRQNGYRIWGNRTTSGDAKWAFEATVRTRDIINDSVLRSHLWAVDRNITRTYVEDVLEGINEYLRSLKAIGAIINGMGWVDPELNTATALQNGEVFFDFDFSPSPIAEHITFRSHVVNDYLVEILPTAA